MVPPPDSTTLKITVLFTVPVTVATNPDACPGATVAVPGASVIDTGFTVTVEAVLTTPSAAVAVTAQLEPPGETFGAVKTPVDGMTPPPAPAGVQVAAEVT